MKKILSLLALLVTTVAAMAASYTDKVAYKMGSTTGSNDEQELTITDNGDNTYDVALADLNTSETLGGLSLGSFTFSSVAGTTTDGVTTISASTTATLANSHFTEKGPGTLEVKFNDSKAYLHYTSTVSYLGMVNYAVELTYGTNDFSTGGGGDPEQPVIEGNPIAGLTNYSPAGDKFEFPFTCDFTKQKLVWKVDFTNAGWTGNQLVFTIGTNDADLSKWETLTGGNAHFYYTKSSADGGKLVCHYLHKGTRNDIDNIAVENVATFTLDAEGFHVGDVLAVPAEKMPKLYEGGTEFIFGSQEGNGRSFVVYDYATVIDLPENPDPDPTTYDYHTKAYVEYNGAYTDIEGGADVVVTEYADGKCSATFKKVTDGVSIYGDLTFNNLTATTSDGGTKYELTDDSKAVWTGVTPVGIMSGITENGDATFSDFFCATGDLAGNDYNFALSFKVNVSGSDLTIVFGEEAPKATSYTGTWNVTRKGSALSESTDNSVVSILLKNESTAQVTIPAFSDLEEEDAGSVASLTFDVNYADALEGETQYVHFLGSNDDVEITEGDWEQQHASITMDGKLVGDQLTATFNVVLNGMEEYTYELGFNVMPFVATTETFNDVANVTFGEQTANFDAASVDVTEYEQGKYSLTYKSLTLNGNEVGDFTISDIAATEDETTGVYTFSTTATKGEWTRVVENNAAGVEAGDEAEIRNFEATLTPAADESEDAGKLVAKFGVNVQGEWADVVFGAKHEEEASEIVLAEDYQADGTGFTFSTPIDWETQKVVISANTESCQRSTEHLFGVGIDGTSWNKNVHMYYTTSDSKLQGYWDGADGGGNNNTGKFDCDGVVKAEISKANGFVVNGETKIAASRMDGLFEMTNIVVGSGEASNQESYALYNYIKIVPIDWTEPAQPEAKTYDGQLQVQDGMTEDKVLEKEEAQAVVTDNLDGTATITLKDVTLGEVTGDVTFTGTYVTAEDSGEDIFMLQGTTDEATTTLFGKEFTAVVNGKYKSDDEVYFTFEMFDADQTTYYVGEFGKNILDVDGVNGISANANAAGTQIFTISGAKVNSLQKGINIVRTADGKTVKVLRK